MGKDALALLAVTLASPVKTDEGWHKPGDVIFVSSTEAEMLEDAGVVADIQLPEEALNAEIARDVAARAAEIAKKAIEDVELREASLKDAVEALEQDKSELAAKVEALEAELAAAKSAAATADKPAPEPVAEKPKADEAPAAKPAPKRAAKTKA